MSFYRGKNYFEEDGTQNDTMYKYFKQINNDYISSWKSKALSNENIIPPSAPNNFFNPSLEYLGVKLKVRFGGSCLKQNVITYNHGKSVNIYIVDEINKTDNTTNSDPTLENCLFGAATLTKDADIININILAMELDLIEEELFHFQVVDLVKMY